MPELWFTVKWPDGSREVCYSPSTVITRFFAPGDRLSLAEFGRRAREALTEAGDRVEAKFGYRCTSADEQLRKIEEKLERWPATTDDVVQVLEIKREP
jgi:uncharacterized repeat protein (TIGR04042 family)